MRKRNRAGAGKWALLTGCALSLFILLLLLTLTAALTVKGSLPLIFAPSAVCLCCVLGALTGACLSVCGTKRKLLAAVVHGAVLSALALLGCLLLGEGRPSSQLAVSLLCLFLPSLLPALRRDGAGVRHRR